MIWDYMLALLSVPLAPESTPNRFAVGSPDQWRDSLTRWLTRARDLDQSLDFELSRNETGLCLRTRRPIAATVTLFLTTEPATVTKLDSDLLVVFACCQEWTAECDDNVLMIEPRWAAAILLDDTPPLFWGVSATEQSPSVLDTVLAPHPTG